MSVAREALALGLAPAALVPGDLAGIQQISDSLRRFAALLDDSGSSLSRVEVTRWRGAAADGWRDVMTVEPGRWWSAADALSQAATTLDGYATSLAAARMVAEAALELYVESASVSGVTSALALTSGRCPEDGLTLSVMAAGQDRAVAMLESARRAVQEAGDLAAQALTETMAAAPEARRFYEQTIRPPGMADGAHLSLDVLGMVPVAGFVPDLVNAAWYAGEGRYVEAGLSGVSAIPGPGDVVGAGVLAGGVGLRALRRLDSTQSLLRGAHEVDLGRGVAPGLLPSTSPGRLLTHVPYGFSSRDSWESFSAHVHDQLARAGVTDVDVFLRGSAVSGIRYRTGEFIALTGPHDLDLAISSPDFLKQAKEGGVRLLAGGTRTMPLRRWALERLGILEATQDLSRVGGVPVTWMVYRDATALLKRGDAILLP